MLRLAVAELARRVRLREVVDPRRAAADRLLRRLRRVQAGDRVEQLARLDADALRVGQMARVLEGHAQREWMTLGPRLLRQQLGDVDDAHVEPRVLQVRAAARGVDGDRVDTGEALGHRLRHPFPLLAPPCMEMERAAAALTARRDDLVALRGQHARRGGVHVAEDDALHAAGEQADPASSLADGRCRLRRQLT